MAADMHIHVLDSHTTEEEVAYFNLLAHASNDERYTTAYDHIAETPQCWIGEVSWLKAALSGDSGTYIPDPVKFISEIIGDGIVLSEAVLREILAALRVENTTVCDIANVPEVEAFLKQHIGKKIFTVSW